MRAVFASRTPAFGSCWGIQVGAVAAGGDVRRNPRGREVGFARNIAPTDAGRSHPMLAGRPPAYDAPTTHLDVVAVPPADCTVLAGNRMAAIQAAEIRVGGAALWACSTIPSSRSPRSARSSTAAGSCCRRGLLPDARGRVGLCRRAQDAPRRPGAPRPRLATWARRRGARPGPAHRRNPQLHRAPGGAGEKPAREGVIRPSPHKGERGLCGEAATQAPEGESDGLGISLARPLTRSAEPALGLAEGKTRGPSSASPASGERWRPQQNRIRAATSESFGIRGTPCTAVSPALPSPACSSRPASGLRPMSSSPRESTASRCFRTPRW